MNNVATTQSVPELTDDDIMRFTQGTRKRFIDKIIDKGFPADEDGQRILLSALSDMDRTALGNKRIGANEKQSAADVLVAKAITELSSRFGSSNPFEGNKEPIEMVVDATLLPEANPVPGETDIGVSTADYDSFMENSG